MLSANKQGAPSESYLQEVREQLEERWEESEENQHHRETRSASDNTGKVCISEQYSQSLATLLDLWLWDANTFGNFHTTLKTRPAIWLPFLHETAVLFLDHPMLCSW